MSIKVIVEKRGRKRHKKKAAKKKKKDDRCTRIAKRKYDAWPSAYASGAVVQCRRGKIWKGIKEDFTDEQLAENQEYEKGLEAKIRKALKDEGGAAGAAMSRDDGRWWAIPIGAVIGSKIGCDAAGG